MTGADYGGALERVLGNLAGRYGLGFAPDETKLDGKLHRLTVKVRSRAEGGRERKLLIRARHGYVAGRVTVGDGQKGHRAAPRADARRSAFGPTAGRGR